MTRVYVPYDLPKAGGVLERPAKMASVTGFEGPADPSLPPPVFPFPVPDCEFRPQAHIQEGQLMPAKFHDAKISGTITADSTDGVTMSCAEPCINGIFVEKNSSYAIKNTEINLIGDGINDFTGRGAGVQVSDTSTVIMENTRVTTTGVIRPCVHAGDFSTLIVRNCELISHGGKIDPNEPKKIGPGMKEPPAPLGLGGNCRTHLSVGNSHSYFYDSKIYADGWAALSVDGCYGDLYLEANRCDVIVKNIGYGAYADIGSNVVLSECKINASHITILAGNARMTLRNCLAHASHYIAMIHSVMGDTRAISELSISGGKLKSSKECIWIKSSNAYLDLKNADLHSESGCLIHSTINDDRMATQLAPYEEAYGIKAVLSDMALVGDIIHEDSQRIMAVSLNHVKLTGGIQNATIALDLSSIWIADKDSTVTITKSIGFLGTIDALPGVTIRAKSDQIEPGTTTLKSGGILIVE